MTDRARYVEAAARALGSPWTDFRLDGAAVVDAVVPLVAADTAEQIAAWLDKIAEGYPPDVFVSAETTDGAAGIAMRHAYTTAARLIRSGAWQDSGGS